MKVLLLNPPSRDDVIMVKEGRCMQRKEAWGYVMAPVSMVTIATLLRDLGHSVRVMDCPAEAQSMGLMLELISGFGPDLVLINTSTPSIDDDIHAAALIKARYGASTRTALYGVHPSCRYPEALSPPRGVDFCIIGEPELAARDLAHALSVGSDLAAVDGLAFVDRTGEVVVTRSRTPIANLDELPIPDWSFVDLGNYRLPLNDQRFLLVNTNRGCPYRCTFCNAYVYYGRAPRRRSVSHVMRELQEDVRRFGVSDFMFWAEEFILDKAFVKELCAAIASSGLGIRWVCNSRVDAVDMETLDAIRQAGCWNIAYGIESGSQDVLDGIEKRTTLGMIERAVRLARAAGLQVTGHVILGFPEDTRETLRATELFVSSLDLDFVQYYCAIPYPGTRLYDDALEHGWLNASDWRRWEHNHSVLDFPHLKGAEVMRTRRRLLRRHYFSPARAARILANHVKRPADALTILSKLRGFLRWM
jgi:radical SAM superfamily enzyme YgiQ (UPF0313 family)